VSITEDITINNKLASYTGEDRVESAEEILKEAKKRPEIQPKPSKMTLVDGLLRGGFFPGQLIVVSGITGHGKTTLAQTWTMNMLGNEEPEKPLWFSYEVTDIDFLKTFEKIDKMYLRHIFMPISMAKNHLKWIEERIIESHLKYGTSLVFIDHLHYLVEMNGTGNMSTRIGETCRGLKQLALKHGMVIFLICHTKQTKGDEELGLGSVRDSSFIEQEADTVFYIWRDEEREYHNVLKIAKNRKGGLIGKKISLKYENGRYFEQSFRTTDNPKADSRTSRRYS
jgi:predicted ATP-dependent serine protease